MKNEINHNWKITIENYGCKYSIELDHADANITEVHEGLRGILGASGWTESIINEIFNEDKDI